MKNLLDFPAPDKMTEIIYVANCTTFRRLLLNQYGRPDLNIDHEIATNPDTKLTYLGYKRFLESDLKYIFPRGANRTANEYKRDCKYLAKQMLLRGDVSGTSTLLYQVMFDPLIILRLLRAQSKMPSLITCGFQFTNQWV